tara:strand:- start:698 stop:898 length:201 start_codon:yes stop_codon:yes gene_type:complete
MKTVRTQQGDTVDDIAYRHYGDTTMVQAILEANRGLARYGIILPHGIEITLPDRVQQTRTDIQLWD